MLLARMLHHLPRAMDTLGEIADGCEPVEGQPAPTIKERLSAAKILVDLVETAVQGAEFDEDALSGVYKELEKLDGKNTRCPAALGPARRHRTEDPILEGEAVPLGESVQSNGGNH